MVAFPELFETGTFRGEREVLKGIATPNGGFLLDLAEGLNTN